MAYFHQADLNWNTQEEVMHRLLRLSDQSGQVSPFLRPGVANILSRLPVLVLSILDIDDRPWTSVISGEPGFTRALGGSDMVIRAAIDRRYDPVMNALLGTEARGETVRGDSDRSKVSIFGIDLEASLRINIHGEVVSGALAEDGQNIGEALLVVRVQQSFVTRTQSLIPRHIISSPLYPRLISDRLPMAPEILALVAKAEVFFVSSFMYGSNLDTNYRTGPPGFLRLDSNDKCDCTLLYPAYVGSRLHRTLDDSSTSTKASLLLPDLDTGNVLFLSGSKESVVRQDANRTIPQITVAIKFSVEAIRFVENGLSFRSILKFSPDNPSSRFFVKQSRHNQLVPKTQKYVTLVNKQPLTPTITRFTFCIEDGGRTSWWSPGQYVTLDFGRQLGIDYIHKYGDDCRSLNNNLLRKFTVSSRPGHLDNYSKFEITIRKVGIATEHLFNHDIKSKLQINLEGFGGAFRIHQDEEEHIAFIAGGVGITPLLAQTGGLDLKRLQLFWTIRAEDLSLVVNSFDRAHGLCECTQVFVTGETDAEAENNLARLDSMHANVKKRRMLLEDLGLNVGNGHLFRKWYVCTSPGLRETVLKWLRCRNVIFETFNY